MGRNRTPTTILEGKGAFIANPARRRKNEPQGKLGIGPAPRRLSDAEKEVWKELADEKPPGVLKRNHRNMFELLVYLTVQFRQRLPMMAAERNLMLSLESRFAGTPADESKVVVEKAPEDDLAEYLDRKKKRQQEVVTETVQ